MPVPEASQYTRRQRVLATASVKGNPRNNNTYYTPSLSASSSPFFLPRTYLTAGSTGSTGSTVPTYIISQSAVEVLEGASVVFTLTTTNVPDGTTLYWTTAGTATSSEFTDGASSGSFTITGGVGTITRTPKMDAILDSTQTFALTVHTGSTAGPVVSTSNVVTIQDSTTIYTISQDVTTVNEGGSVVFTLTTTNVPSGTTLYWTTAGTATSSEFTDGASSGSFTITGGVGTITRTVNIDNTADPTQTFMLTVRTGSITGPIVSTSANITIPGTEPIYMITPSVTSVDEGSSVTYTVTTTNVPDTIVLYWTNSGTTSAADFFGGQNSGNLSVGDNYPGEIIRTILTDAIGFEMETIILQLRTGSITGPIVATAGTVSVVDKTIAYAVAADKTSLSEGETATFTVTTSGVGNGSTLYWIVDSTSGVNASDFTNNASTGSFTINSNTATITRTLKDDVYTEGAESFTLRIRATSSSSGTLARSSTVTISDTSIGPNYAWTSVGTEHPWGEMCMSWDGTVLLATYYNTFFNLADPTLWGTYVSTNGGTTWTRKVSGLPTDEPVNCIALAKNSPNIMYAYAGSSVAKLFKSSDTGNTWIELDSPTSYWYSITCSSDGQVVMATDATTTLHYSTNGGTTWLTHTFPGSIAAYSTAISADGSIMFVGDGNGNNGTGTTLWRSTDTGATWSPIASAGDLPYIYPLRCSSDGQVLVVGDSNTNTWRLSTDGGTTITPISYYISPTSALFNGVAVSSNGNVIMITSSNPTSEIYISIDRGVTWNTYIIYAASGWRAGDVNATGSKAVLGGYISPLFVGAR